MPRLAVAVAHNYIVVFFKDSVFMLFMDKAKSASMQAKLRRHKVRCKEQVQGGCAHFDIFMNHVCNLSQQSKSTILLIESVIFWCIFNQVKRVSDYNMCCNFWNAETWLSSN